MSDFIERKENFDIFKNLSVTLALKLTIERAK